MCMWCVCVCVFPGKFFNLEAKTAERRRLQKVGGKEGLTNRLLTPLSVNSNQLPKLFYHPAGQLLLTEFVEGNPSEVDDTLTRKPLGWLSGNQMVRGAFHTAKYKPAHVPFFICSVDYIDSFPWSANVDELFIMC